MGGEPLSEKKFLVGHVIADANHQKVLMDVTEFCKDLGDCKTQFSTSAVMVTINKAPSMFQGQQQIAQVQIITSCLITWMATKEQADKHFSKFKILQG